LDDGEIRNPIKIPEVDNNIVHIFKPHSIGNFYISGTDTSHGVGKDYSVTVILNVKTGEVVADILHNRFRKKNWPSKCQYAQTLSESLVVHRGQRLGTVCYPDGYKVGIQESRYQDKGQEETWI